MTHLEQLTLLLSTYHLSSRRPRQRTVLNLTGKRQSSAQTNAPVRREKDKGCRTVHVFVCACSESVRVWRLVQAARDRSVYSIACLCLSHLDPRHLEHPGITRPQLSDQVLNLRHLQTPVPSNSARPPLSPRRRGSAGLELRRRPASVPQNRRNGSRQMPGRVLG